MKLENETLNGEVEKLMKESDMMQQMQFDKMENNDTEKSQDVNYEELLKNINNSIGEKNKYEDLKQEY